MQENVIKWNQKRLILNHVWIPNKTEVSIYCYKIFLILSITHLNYHTMLPAFLWIVCFCAGFKMTKLIYAMEFCAGVKKTRVWCILWYLELGSVAVHHAGRVSIASSQFGDCSKILVTGTEGRGEHARILTHCFIVSWITSLWWCIFGTILWSVIWEAILGCSAARKSYKKQVWMDYLNSDLNINQKKRV